MGSSGNRINYKPLPSINIYVYIPHPAWIDIRQNAANIYKDQLDLPCIDCIDMIWKVGDRIFSQSDFVKSHSALCFLLLLGPFYKTDRQLLGHADRYLPKRIPRPSRFCNWLHWWHQDKDLKINTNMCRAPPWHHIHDDFSHFMQKRDTRKITPDWLYLLLGMFRHLICSVRNGINVKFKIPTFRDLFVAKKICFRRCEKTVMALETGSLGGPWWVIGKPLGPITVLRANHH